MIFAIFKYFSFAVALFLIARELWMVYQMWQLCRRNPKFTYLYFPFIGLAWDMILQKGSENEWKWCFDIVNKADKTGSTAVVANNMMLMRPSIIPVCPKLIADFFKDELKISRKFSLSTDPLI